MEIFKLLDTLEDLINDGRKIPLSDKCIVNQNDILEIIQEIRKNLPEELKQAKWVKEERERILNEAKKEADGMVKDAENKTIFMIDEHEITKKAYEQKNQIVSQANESSREITQGAREYADNILANLSETLEKTLKEIESNRKELK